MSLRLDPIEIRRYRPGDETGIVACYNRVFAAAGMPARSLAHWRWKFVANPVGDPHVVVADHARDGIVGTYAAIPYRVWIDGRQLHAAQGVDLVVRPEFRRHGPPPGLFITMGRYYHDNHCGHTDDKAVFFFGWPIPAWKHGHKHLGYQIGRDWDFLFRDHGGAGFGRRPKPAEVRVEPLPRCGAEVDELSARLQQEVGICLIRDARYLNWRYVDHPDRTYRLAACRDAASGALRGVAVYTVADLLRPNTAFIVDWIVPGDDEAAAAALLGWAELQADADGTQVLAAVFNQVDRRFLGFQQLGYRVLGSTYFVAIVPYRFEMRYFREQWYFTLGDSDLI